MTSTLTRKDYLRRLLCPLWLRPESALWYAHESALAREFIGQMQSPSLELGCMEGVSTFVMLGGEFGPEFDVYSEVSWNRDSLRWKSLQDDYYDVKEIDRQKQIDIRLRPVAGFDVGLGWKRAHIEKAARLRIHNRFVEHDPNSPLDMFDDASFATVWAPNLYWIDNLEGLLRELHRALQADGRLITVLPDRAALDHMLYRFADRADPEWIKDLDRGRYDNVSRQARSLREWNRVFEASGLAVTKHERFLPELVFRVNDIGLRPLFPALINIYETLREKCPDDWLAVKQQWIDTTFHFLAPLCEMEWMDRMNMNKVWHIFELRKDNQGSHS